MYAYYPGVDEIAHAHGLHDGYYDAELAFVDRLVGDVLTALPPSATLLVTADHGQVHLGEDAWLPLGATGDFVEECSGDGRFRYLHARRGAAADLLAAARDEHGDRAWVLSREELLDGGWLGPPPSAVIGRRIGDVVLAARDAVGFVDPELPREAELRSAHGSLTAAEMLVPLLGGHGGAVSGGDGQHLRIRHLRTGPAAPRFGELHVCSSPQGPVRILWMVGLLDIGPARQFGLEGSATGGLILRVNEIRAHTIRTHAAVTPVGKSFVHLHLHTEYSMLDGASRIADVVASAVEDGQPAVGITDHGNMYGVLDLYRSAREAGVKPIVGMEAYFTVGDRRDKPRRVDGDITHLTLLAESDAGYHNLIKVSSGAYLDGFHYKPRVDFELLGKHHEGLIGTSGCLGSAVCQALLAGDEQRAREIAGRFQDVLGRESYFIELQDHGLADQHRVNTGLIRLARDLGAPLLATNDSHYTHRGDAEAHAALLCVQTGTTLDDPNRFKFEANEFYLKTSAEMRATFSDYEEACDNTLWIAERADVEIEFGNAVLPTFATPEGHDEDSYLRELTLAGARERYGAPIPVHVSERLEHELGVIKTMGFSAYFLVVWDLVRYARESGIRVGPGRGSAAGSCVAFCLRIVDIDPIRYDLLFERFLNPGRKQMPDIDMDFDSRYRADMIRYVAQRYGEDHVAQIVTFSTIKARAAVRDGSRVLGYPYRMGDRIAKLMPPLVMGRDTPLGACLELRPGQEDGYKMASELRELYATDPDAKRVIDVAKGLEGLRRQDGIHAAAVVITREPLTEYLPIQRGRVPQGDVAEGPIVTQYEMHGVEELGLLKMDFLGLRNLDVIEITLDLVEASTGQRPDADALPLDDPKTFEMLCRGDTVGVFQLEGTAVRSLLRSLAPNRFEDIAALVALYRPGPMAQNWHTEYADRKNGRKPVDYPHPDLEEILAPTYGLMIYQEQLMRGAAARRLHARRSRQPAQGDRQEDPRAHRAASARSSSKAVCRRATTAPSVSGSSTRSSPSPTTRSTSRTPSATACSRTKPPT